MRALAAWAAGSLLFALAGCTQTTPPPGAANATRTRPGGEEVAAAVATTDAGARVFGAEPLGALVVESVPVLAGEPRTSSMTVVNVSEPTGPQPVYRPPASLRGTSRPPPPPPPPPVVFPAPSTAHGSDDPPAGWQPVNGTPPASR
jgi:hypothetical protein